MKTGHGIAVIYKCDNCGKYKRTGWNSIKNNKHHFCSTSCTAEWQKINLRGENNPSWQGGLSNEIIVGGYIAVRNWEHPNHSIQGYVYKHRLVMEEALDRYLESSEVVHHRDGNPFNNELENLELFKTRADHTRYHHGRKKAEPKQLAYAYI